MRLIERYIDLVKGTIALSALQMVLEFPKRLRTVALGYKFYFSLHKTFSRVASCGSQPHYYQPWYTLWLQIK